MWLSKVLGFIRRNKVPVFISAFVATVLATRLLKKRKAQRLHDQCLGLILATAVGDAKGIPYENQTKEQIQQRLARNEPNDKELFALCYDHPFIPADFTPGMWTDDTQLSLAMMVAIMESHLQKPGSLDMNLVVREHIKEWKTTTTGWGGSKTAIERLHNREKGYRNSGNQAYGNGVLMKLSPLAYYYSLLPHQDHTDEIELLARMTHDTPVAVVTALVQAYFFEHLYRNGEAVISSKAKKSSVLMQLLDYAESLESRYFISQREEKEFLTSRLRKLNEFVLNSKDGTLTDDQLILVANGGTYFCVDSCTMVIGLIIGTKQLNFDTILRAVYIGGDTDSNAAMVGALIGGLKGASVVPQEYISKLDQHERLVHTAKQFAKVMNNELRAYARL
jgi:ADP-ribosylglycohydrolase